MKSMIERNFRAALVAAVLCIVWWGMLFTIWNANFFLYLSIGTTMLAIFSLAIDRRQLSTFRMRDIWIGVISAAALYAIFFIGGGISKIVLPSEAAKLSSIYELGRGIPRWLLGIMLAMPIGFGEELFWRGCVQRLAAERWSPRIGFAITVAIYTALHISSLNLVLIGAAAVCGTFWGYIYYRTNSIMAVIISHMIWDPLIFVILPVSL